MADRPFKEQRATMPTASSFINTNPHKDIFVMLWTFVFYRGTQAHLARKSQIVSLLGRVAVKEPDALGDIDLYLHSKDDRCDYYISGAVPLLYNDPMAAERDPDDLPDECRRLVPIKTTGEQTRP
jgi:hypothetical protein